MGKNEYMKIAIVRGSFACPQELQNFEPLAKKHQVVVFCGKNISIKPINLELFPLNSLYDFTKQRLVRGVINRVLIDNHYLFGLEKALMGFDIAHCAETYFYYTRQCLNAKRKGLIKSVVSTVWENILFNNEGIIGRKEMKNDAFKNINRFLPVTKKSRQVLIEEGCPSNKIEVLMPGVNLSLFKKLKLSSYYGINKNNKLKILFVGRLEKEKGILDVIQIFSALRNKYNNIELIVVGHGSLYNKINLPGVRLMGQIPYADMPKVYSLADIFIHYSTGSKTWQEQYGMVLVEAMACGLPTVVLNRGSVGEVVGEAGFVISEEKIRPKLEELILRNDLRRKIAIKARLYAMENYDNESYAKRLENIYNTVLTER